METGLPHHPRHLSRRLGLYKSTLPNPQFQNFRNDAVLSMRDLPLSRIAARRLFAHRFRDPKAVCIRIPDLMADESSKTQPQESMANSNKEGEQQPERSPPPPPPLPEKPLPGDCCGSGCVRCVWDVYYEELEAYNEYYRNESKHKS